VKEGERIVGPYIQKGVFKRNEEMCAKCGSEYDDR
jgi:hypothetical protein